MRVSTFVASDDANRIYFLVDRASLWTSDGSAANTNLLVNPNKHFLELRTDEERLEPRGPTSPTWRRLLPIPRQ